MSAAFAEWGDAMGYVYVVALSFTVAFASFAAYDEESSRASRFALGVILLAALVPLLTSFVSDVKDGDFLRSFDSDYGSVSGGEVFEEVLYEAYCSGVRDAVAEKFDLPVDNIRVSCAGFCSESASCERISVTLSGRAALGDILAIKRYVSEISKELDAVSYHTA